MALEQFTHALYVLRDPRTYEIRYIGQTRRYRRRVMEHTNRPADSRLGTWMQELRALDLKPIDQCLEWTNESNAKARERFWIAKGRERGWPLLNVCDGGDGWFSPMPQDVRDKISRANKGRVKSEEWLAKLAASQRGKVVSAETKQKISEANSGRVQSDEEKQIHREATGQLWQDDNYRKKVVTAQADPAVRAEMSRKAKLRWQNPEEVAKMTRGRKGRRHSLETRQKIAAAQRAYWARKREEAKKANS